MRISTAVFVGATVLILAMGFKIYELGERVRADAEAAEVASTEVLELRQLQRGLLDLVNASVPERKTLSGIDVTSGGEVVHELSEGSVLYVFATHCSWSPTNVQLLNELHARGLNVVGVVPTEPVRSVEVFVRSHSPEFPVLARPSGRALSLLPGGATPLTAILGAEGIERLWLGPVDDDRHTVLQALITPGPL